MGDGVKKMISSIVSYAKRPIFEQLPGMMITDYFLPESENGVPSILHVEDSHYYKPDIEGNQDSVFVPSQQIVTSIVHMHNTSQIEYTVNQHPAVFAIPNEAVDSELVKAKHADKIKQALEAQKKWFVRLVQVADDDWQQARRHNMVSDIQRTAARELGLKREWLLTILDENEKPSCPFCGSGLLNPNAPICPTCGKIHNPQRMAQLEAQFKPTMTTVASKG